MGVPHKIFPRNHCKSLSQKENREMKKPRKVFGVGINDANYTVRPIGPDGKRAQCPYHRVWEKMLERAYSPAYHARNPTYIGVTVCEKWHSFMAFRAWMERQAWQGKHLDKDIIVPGNKVYSPDTCVFVPPAINTLLIDSAASRGEWPIGVCWNKLSKKFLARVSIAGRDKHLGYFTCPHEAHMAWRKAKVRLIRDAAREQDEPRIYAGLMRHAARIECGELTENAA
jgi:hypothetical protein